MIWSPALKGGCRFAIAYLLACAATLAVFPHGSIEDDDHAWLYLLILLAVVAVWPAWRFAHETDGRSTWLQRTQFSAWSLLGCLPTWCLVLVAIWTMVRSHQPFPLQHAVAIATSGQTLLGLSLFFVLGLVMHALALRIVYGVLVAVFGVMVSTTSPEARRRQREADRATRELDEFDLESVRRWAASDQPIKRKEPR